MSVVQLKQKINLFLILALLLNLAIWMGSRQMYAKWSGVPPVPDKRGALMMALGDAEFSFRSGALTLQSLGDSGGRTTPLNDYNYKALGRWFYLLNDLNPASDHLPMVAGYYFGAVQKPESVRVVIDFLTTIGQNPAGEKWRWLGEAAFLARHRLKDLDLALDIAYTLSRMQPVDEPLPAWARQFPAFILKAQDEKQAARQIMETMLLTDKDLPWQEVNFMTSWLIEQLGVPEEDVAALLEKRKEL